VAGLCDHNDTVLHVFIDTNVLLTFFSFAEDDLEELRKIQTTINNNELKLWMTSQVIDELRRNRESKVAESMSALRKLKPAGGIPQIARNLPEFGDFLGARREFERHLSLLCGELLSQFDGGTLAADDVLRELLEATDTIAIDDDIVDAARRRVDVGNPPGKKGSLGDAINWECLLRCCPAGEDLHLVSADSDFVSKMDSERVSSSLAEEWRDAKSAEVHLYKRLSSFSVNGFRISSLPPSLRRSCELDSSLRAALLGKPTEPCRLFRTTRSLRNSRHAICSIA
jgi:hypothetical protein